MSLLNQLKILQEQIKTKIDGLGYSVKEEPSVYNEIQSKLPMPTEFVITTHYAKRAGKHHDIRIKLKDDYWYCWVSRKDLESIINSNEKRGIVPTSIHNNDAAKTVGIIDDGYGAGELEEWDSGKCTIIYWNLDDKIKIDFNGGKIKGDYYIIKPKNQENFKGYLFFKAKDK